ncbi:TIM barrel protein [Candidatus Micrarchaeota archaeon]|nr:TIM barrel protein [Candidatus Micrarchaeota archaeon]
MDRLRFGTAGIPLKTVQRKTVFGIETVRSLHLDAMELEFVHSVHVTPEKAPWIKEAAKKNGVALTCHAPYYMNLNAQEKPTLEASKQRLIKSARILDLCGGKSVAFHAAFYMKQEKETVYQNVRHALKEIMQVLKDESIPVIMRPELMGKPKQFGSLEEIIRLCEEIENVQPCIDWGHFIARTNGKTNSKEAFVEVLETMENRLGRETLDHVHFHVEGIEFAENGERRHVALKDSPLKYKDLASVWKTFKLKGIVISESPNIESDALLMQKLVLSK